MNIPQSRCLNKSLKISKRTLRTSTICRLFKEAEISRQLTQVCRMLNVALILNQLTGECKMFIVALSLSLIKFTARPNNLLTTQWRVSSNNNHHLRINAPTNSLSNPSLVNFHLMEITISTVITHRSVEISTAALTLAWKCQGNTRSQWVALILCSNYRASTMVRTNTYLRRTWWLASDLLKYNLSLAPPSQAAQCQTAQCQTAQCQAAQCQAAQCQVALCQIVVL